MTDEEPEGYYDTAIGREEISQMKGREKVAGKLERAEARRELRGRRAEWKERIKEKKEEKIERVRELKQKISKRKKRFAKVYKGLEKAIRGRGTKKTSIKALKSRKISEMRQKISELKGEKARVRELRKVTLLAPLPKQGPSLLSHKNGNNKQMKQRWL